MSVCGCGEQEWSGLHGCHSGQASHKGTSAQQDWQERVVNSAKTKRLHERASSYKDNAWALVLKRRFT
jgi:hypothetical protein